MSERAQQADYLDHLANVSTLEAGPLRAGAQALRERWQDIASAPKDGTPIVLFINETTVVIASWLETTEFATWTAVDEFHHPDSWEGGSCWDDVSADEQPTRWMPLPSPPQVGQEPTP